VVSLEKKLVAVATRDGQDISDAELTKALIDSGYEVKGITRTQRSLDEIRAGLEQKKK
jgi:GDP-D-mannose dehydratase